MKKALSILIALLFLGCDQLEIHNEKPENDETPKTQETSVPDKTKRIQSSALSDEIKIIVQGTDPEKYAIQFSWPYLEDEKILRVRLGSVLAEVLSNQTFFTHTLPHNQTVTFSFDVLDKNRRPEHIFTKTVRIPTDFVAKAEFANINENTRLEVNRLYLSDEFPLTTNGNTVDIVTNELHAERGFIQSFPKKIKVKNTEKNIEEEYPPTAKPEKNGRAGGNISISGKKLFGRLKVYMRGENGGQGPKGEPTEGQSSGIGTPAGDGRTLCLPDPSDSCSRHPERCLINPTFTPRDCYCDKYGLRGGQGFQGGKGKPGKIGMTGGDSGNVKISIHEYIPLEGFDPTLPSEGGEVVQVFQVAGSGGKGGPGGDGQRGSPGGPGRNPNDSKDCRGNSGPEGDRGKSGDEGPIGHSGKIGLKCIYVGSENVNECTQ